MKTSSLGGIGLTCPGLTEPTDWRRENESTDVRGCWLAENARTERLRTIQSRFVGTRGDHELETHDSAAEASLWQAGPWPGHTSWALWPSRTRPRTGSTTVRTQASLADWPWRRIGQPSGHNLEYQESRPHWTRKTGARPARGLIIWRVAALDRRGKLQLGR